ncbi:MAG: ribbon-helix-helix protein, CopG family [Anaerolineales bacterium]|nr:ribbon-helix-helix protein, CopG family [Anaerolineales bacterium]
MNKTRKYQERTGRRKVFLAIRIDEPLALRIDALALERGVSRTALLVRALKAEVNEVQSAEPANRR